MKKGDIPSEDLGQLMETALQVTSEATLITHADVDTSGPTICFANEAFEKLSGYSVEELLGKTPEILQGPETEEEVISELASALREGRKWRGETVNYRKDGSSYRVDWRVEPVEVDGKIKYWLSFQKQVAA